MNKSNIVDKAISNKVDDLLKVEKYSIALSNFIERSDTPITIGLQGEWADHLTSAVLPVKQDRLYLPWQLTAERLHWVEVGHG